MTTFAHPGLREMLAANAQTFRVTGVQLSELAFIS